MPTVTDATGSFILHERAKNHYWSGEGWLSLKSFYGGRVVYENHGRFAVADHNYLLLNHQQPYTIALDNDQPLESFCLFFSPRLAADVAYNAHSKFERLLDQPQPTAATPPAVFDRTYTHNQYVTPLLQQLRHDLKQGVSDPVRLTEQLHAILYGILQTQTAAVQEMEQLTAVRPATRTELYRRLYHARDYTAASFTQNITLADIANAAYLSPNHLLRTFKQLFGCTPHQYLTQLRLHHAQTLLRTTDQSVTDICLAVGFHSLGSFSTLFQRHLGLSPQIYRQQNG